MSKEISHIHRPDEAVLPQLDDPKHPGMLLVSKIALFSLTLFLILFVLLAIVGNNVTLDFELNATASFTEAQLRVTIDERQASVFEPGDEVVVQFDSGPFVIAKVAEMGTPAKGRLIMIVAVADNNLPLLSNIAGTQDISLTVQQPLKDFIISKLSL